MSTAATTQPITPTMKPSITYAAQRRQEPRMDRAAGRQRRRRRHGLDATNSREVVAVIRRARPARSPRGAPSRPRYRARGRLRHRASRARQARCRGTRPTCSSRLPRSSRDRARARARPRAPRRTRAARDRAACRRAGTNSASPAVGRADLGFGADRGRTGLQGLQLAELVAFLDRQRRAREHGR